MFLQRTQMFCLALLIIFLTFLSSINSQSTWQTTDIHSGKSFLEKAQDLYGSTLHKPRRVLSLNSILKAPLILEDLNLDCLDSIDNLNLDPTFNATQQSYIDSVLNCWNSSPDSSVKCQDKTYSQSYIDACAKFSGKICTAKSSNQSNSLQLYICIPLNCTQKNETKIAAENFLDRVKIPKNWDTDVSCGLSGWMIFLVVFSVLVVLFMLIVGILFFIYVRHRNHIARYEPI